MPVRTSLPDELEPIERASRDELVALQLDRLRTSLSWMPDPVDPVELVRRLREDVARFADGAEPADDITLVALRWEGPAPV